MIPEISAERAIAQIDAAIAAAGGAGVALATDGDGTLWTSDVGDALLQYALADGRIGEPAREALLSEAKAFGLEVDGDPVSITRALDAAYHAGRYPEERLYMVTAWCMAGMARRDVDAYCDDALRRRFDLEGHLIEESIALLRWASTRVPIWLVSASPRPLIERAAAIVSERIGVVPSVIAMSPRWVADVAGADVMACGIEGVSIYGEGKKQALDVALGGRTLVCAMGDNRFDAAMLRAAKVPLAVRPKPALEAIAAEIPGLQRLATA